MPPLTEIKTTFTIDLTPFAAGLKTMLGMTQAAGRQIIPLLNLQMKAPQVGVFDEQVKELEKTVDEYIQQQGGVAKASVSSAAAIEDLGKKTEQSRIRTDRHVESFRGLRREALQIFGAVSFLGTSLVQLASQASGGSKELDKLSRGMSQGISAGFGLASLLMLINPALGGTAVVIGSVVAIGATLLTFFTDTEDRAKAAAAMVDEFKRALRGASVESLMAYERSLGAAVKSEEVFVKTTQLLMQQRREELSKGAEDISVIAGALALDEVYQKLKQNLDLSEKQLIIYKESYKAVGDEITGKLKTDAEVQKETERDLLDAIANRFTRERQMKMKEFEETKNETEKIREYLGISEETKNARIAAARKKLRTELAEIDKQEKDERDRTLKEKEDKEREHRRTLADLELQAAIAVLDTNEIKESATAKTEIERLAIQERYALQRIDLETTEKLAFVKTEEEKTAILKKAEADRQKIRTATGAKVSEIGFQRPEGSIAAQQEAVRKTQEELNRARTDEDRKGARARLLIEQKTLDAMTMSAEDYFRKYHRMQSTLIDGVTTGFTEMFGQMLIRQRQAKDEWDAAWLAMRNSVLQAISQIISEQIRAAIIERLLKGETETEKTAATAIGTTTRIALNTAETTSNLTTAASEGAAGTAAAARGAATSVPIFPFNLIAIAAAIAAATVLFMGISKAFGFQKGGLLKRGQTGFIEGFDTEIIAPEKDFNAVMRLNIIPRLIRETQLQTQAIAIKAAQRIEVSRGAGGFDSRLMDRFENAIARLEKLEWTISGRDLKTVSRKQDEFDSRKGLG